MDFTMDDAVTSHIKSVEGSSTIVTGWVLVTAVAEGALEGAPLGFTLSWNTGLPEYAQLGLLESAVQSIKGDQFRSQLGLPKPPQPPKPSARDDDIPF